MIDAKSDLIDWLLASHTPSVRYKTLRYLIGEDSSKSEVRSTLAVIMADPPGIEISNKQKGQAAAVLTTAVMPRGPRRNKGYTVVIDSEVCRSCGRCVAVCPYQAITLHRNQIGGWYAAVDEAFCKGCGNCISVCPSDAADSPYRSQKFFEWTLEEILLQ